MAHSDNPEPLVSEETMGTGITPGGKARVSSVVGLSLLEVIRALDLPTEVLAAEDPTRLRGVVSRRGDRRIATGSAGEQRGRRPGRVPGTE